MARPGKAPALVLVVVLVLWTADGLLLSKPRVTRDAHRRHDLRKIITPGDFRNTHYDGISEAHDSFGAMFRRTNPENVASMTAENTSTTSGTTTTTSLPTTTAFSTTATTDKTTAGRGAVTESTTSQQEKLQLRPVILAERLIPRIDDKKDVVWDLNKPGVANLTDSMGLKVTLVKEDIESETKISKQLIRGGGKFHPTCVPEDLNKPILVAGCGEYYLFPGYNVQLFANTLPCRWHFRYTAPVVIVSSKSIDSEQDIGMIIEETNVPTSSDGTSTATGKQLSYGLGGHVPRDLIIELHNDLKVSEVPGEVCVPASPQNEQFDEYALHDGVYSSTAAEKNCGIPLGSIDAANFSMQTFPWEVVLSVKMMSTIQGEEDDVTYCSGTLISEEWLLTTAACILRPKKKHPNTKPEINANFVLDPNSDKPESYAVREYIVYPTSSEAHDITLVRLDGMSSRSPLCLPPYNVNAINEGVVNDTEIVFGWVLEDGPPYMSTRKQRVINSDECSVRLGEVLSPHVLCTVDLPSDEPCLADGHLLEGTDQFTLRGLSIPRLQCKDDLRQHSSIAHFMPWISHITGIKIRST